MQTIILRSNKMSSHTVQYCNKFQLVLKSIMFFIFIVRIYNNVAKILQCSLGIIHDMRIISYFPSVEQVKHEKCLLQHASKYNHCWLFVSYSFFFFRLQSGVYQIIPGKCSCGGVCGSLFEKYPTSSFHRSAEDEQRREE